MRAVSLFSGVGGFDLGFERAGIDTVLQVDLFDASHLSDAELGEPCAIEHANKTHEQRAAEKRRDLNAYGGALNGVLSRHWAEVERVNDVRTIREGWAPRVRERTMGAGDGESDAQHVRQSADLARNGTRRGDASHDAQSSGGRGGIDLVYGGFPCQDVSVAGARAGLAGERSGLWFEFERVVSELRPRWVVIENVPGLLSSNGGRDFAVILAGLDELGFDAAWAVLDAQHFGIPQRRRRVFIVGGPRGRGAEQVLSLCESCGGNPETVGVAGKDVAGTLGGGSGARGFADDTDRIANAISASNAVRTSQRENDTKFVVMPTLDTNLGAKQWLENQSIGNYGLMDEAGAGVRHLTPRECERLQGFPDDWTRYGADGREIADSHRYRMLGNAVAVPVAEWVGHRIVAVDALL